MPTVGRLRSPRLTSPPTSPAVGEMYFDTGASKLYWWNGSIWVDASGLTGPVGSWVSVLSAKKILDAGGFNGCRVGRKLAAADFSAAGLGVPIALWNMSDTSDASGNGRTLTNKGSVAVGPFSGTYGVDYNSTGAANFVGNTAQALYIPDTGSADPFRIRTGSWGCWLKTARRGDGRHVLSRGQGTGSQYGWFLGTSVTNALYPQISLAGNDAPGVYGVTDVCDDRWHFGVATYDGTTLRAYVDGVLDSSLSIAGVIFASSAALNIGSYNADAATAALAPFYGQIDEAFVTSDVLSLDQIRFLYCAKIPHTLGKMPTAASLNVRRQRKGAALVRADLGSQGQTAVRIHNGSLADVGSQGVALTNNGGAVVVAGPTGALGTAWSFRGSQSLSSSDAGLVSGTNPRSYGCWLKTTSTAGMGVMGWGTYNSADARIIVGYPTAGCVTMVSGSDQIAGPFIADGQWHFVVVTEYNNSLDAKRKLYVDGRLVASSMVLNTLTLGGVNNFRIGANPDGSSGFVGLVGPAFVMSDTMSQLAFSPAWLKSAATSGPSSKDPGAHIEAMDASNLYAVFDTIEPQQLIDVAVGA